MSIRKISQIVALLGALTLLGSSLPVQAATTSTGKLPAVITISSQGGFVAPGYIKTALPNLVGYSDGVVLQNDTVGIRSDIMTMSRRSVSASWLKKQALAISKLTKTPKGGWGSPGVADVPDTRIRINLGKTQVNVGIYALSFTNGDLTSAQISARKALSRALDTLVKNVNRAKPTILKPAKYEVWAFAEIVSSGGLGIANPASVFCTSMGGTLGSVTTPDGEAGTCSFGSQTFDEWTYYREESAKLSPWPDGQQLPVQGCSTISASVLKPSLTVFNETGLWVLPSGQAINLTFRPVLAGEVACRR